MTTIGLVNAGLLTFPQGLGLVFGANVGATGMDWLVALIGVRVSLAAYALPMISWARLPSFSPVVVSPPLAPRSPASRLFFTAGNASAGHGWACGNFASFGPARSARCARRRLGHRVDGFADLYRRRQRHDRGHAIFDRRHRRYAFGLLCRSRWHGTECGADYWTEHRNGDFRDGATPNRAVAARPLIPSSTAARSRERKFIDRGCPIHAGLLHQHGF